MSLTCENRLSSPGLSGEITDFQSRVERVVQGELEYLVSESEDALRWGHVRGTLEGSCAP